MGVDLRLIIVHDKNRRWWLANNTLGLDRDYTLQAYIKNAERPKPLPDSVTLTVYGDDGVYDAKEDPYGDSLTWIESKSFGAVPIVTEFSSWNSAVITFLKMLPRDTAVVLWWH